MNIIDFIYSKSNELHTYAHMYLNHNLIYIDNTIEFKCSIGTGISDVVFIGTGSC